MPCAEVPAFPVTAVTAPATTVSEPKAVVPTFPVTAILAAQDTLSSPRPDVDVTADTP